MAYVCVVLLRVACGLCAEAYRLVFPVVQVRALYNLCTTEPNTALAVKLGAADVVEAILESHGEDGQLVFRTNNLLAVLREGEEEEEVVRI